MRRCFGESKVRHLFGSIVPPASYLLAITSREYHATSTP